MRYNHTLSFMFRLQQETQTCSANSFFCLYLNPNESRSCVSWEVADDLLVGARTVKIFSFSQNDSCHPDPTLVTCSDKSVTYTQSICQTHRIHSYQICKTRCNISPGTISDISVVTFHFNTVDIRLQNARNHRENVCNL